MDPESKEKLDATFELLKENNKLLHQLRRHLRTAQIFRVVYWVFIIGLALSAYYVAQPYVEEVKGVYGGAQNNINNFNSILDSFND